MKVKIISKNQANSCYFRTSMRDGRRKALVKITERCNLKCAHCFVSSGPTGNDITLEDFKSHVIPELISANVVSVTLTGGEPFVHPKILEIIEAIDNANMSISICTNGVGLSEATVNRLSQFSNISINVSMDGFSELSHGRFRGNRKSFYETINTIKLLGDRKLLKGILSTPNKLTSVTEYIDLAKYAIQNNAKYLLMNPLGSMGRGEKSAEKLKMDNESMNKIRLALKDYSTDLEIVDIRFPNTAQPLSSCEAGNIIYVFTNGDVTVCPYLSFSVKTKNSKYPYDTFTISNVFNGTGLGDKLANFNMYKKYNLGDNPKCNSCDQSSTCGKGCPAAIIANGDTINNIDSDLCPKYVY